MVVKYMRTVTEETWITEGKTTVKTTETLYEPEHIPEDMIVSRGEQKFTCDATTPTKISTTCLDTMR